MKIPIVNRKGGVAKSTTTFNLGAALAQAGRLGLAKRDYRTLIIDMDPQASTSYALTCGFRSRLHDAIRMLESRRKYPRPRVNRTTKIVANASGGCSKLHSYLHLVLGGNLWSRTNSYDRANATRSTDTPAPPGSGRRRRPLPPGRSKHAGLPASESERNQCPMAFVLSNSGIHRVTTIAPIPIATHDMKMISAALAVR